MVIIRLRHRNYALYRNCLLICEIDIIGLLSLLFLDEFEENTFLQYPTAYWILLCVPAPAPFTCARSVYLRPLCLPAPAPFTCARSVYPGPLCFASDISFNL